MQPAIPLRLACAEVIENHVNLLPGTAVQHIIHEIQKLPAAALLGLSRLQLCGHYGQSLGQRDRAVRSVAMVEILGRLAVGETQIPLRSLRLRRLRHLVHA